MVVSSAILEGRVAAENAVLGTRRRTLHGIVPGGGFTDPEYGNVGLTDKQARARYDCAVASYALGEYSARGDPDGRGLHGGAGAREGLAELYQQKFIYLCPNVFQAQIISIRSQSIWRFSQ